MTENQQVTLYDYWRSSAAYRVRIALFMLNVPFEQVAVDLLAGEQTGPDHLARNPQGLVPALEIDGLCLTQSLSIVEYLDETRGAGILPANASDRAKVRALAMAIAMEIHPVCNLRVARYAVAKSGGAIDQGEWMRHFIAQGLTDVEAMLATLAGQFCFGNVVTLADICLVPQMYNARRWQVDLSALPRCVAIDARLQAIPAFAKAAPVAP